jgi:hypothetical protein
VWIEVLALVLIATVLAVGAWLPMRRMQMAD